MTLAGDIAAALPGLRREAEAMMQDRFVAYAPDGTTVDGDGFEVPAYASHGSTPGRIAGPSSQSRDTQTRTVTIGGSERPVIEGGLHLPLDAEVPSVGEYGNGWEYVLVEAGPLTDPSLENSRWLVVDAPAKSYATARRLDVVRLA